MVFLRKSQSHKVIVLTEGETDSRIIANAWKALRNGKTEPFELRSALGAKNINITLNDGELTAKLAGRKIFGVFDFDDAFNHWNGLWTNSISGHTIIKPADETLGITKKRSDSENCFATLLPVPAFRSKFASQLLGGGSILSIEFLFEDKYHISDLVRTRVIAAAGPQPYINKGKKVAFAEHTDGLPPAAFAAFEPLLCRIEAIASGSI